MDVGGILILPRRGGPGVGVPKPTNTSVVQFIAEA